MADPKRILEFAICFRSWLQKIYNLNIKSIINKWIGRFNPSIFSSITARSLQGSLMFYQIKIKYLEYFFNNLNNNDISLFFAKLLEIKVDIRGKNCLIYPIQEVTYVLNVYSNNAYSYFNELLINNDSIITVENILSVINNTIQIRKEFVKLSEESLHEDGYNAVIEYSETHDDINGAFTMAMFCLHGIRKDNGND